MVKIGDSSSLKLYFAGRAYERKAAIKLTEDGSTDEKVVISEAGRKNHVMGQLKAGLVKDEK